MPVFAKIRKFDIFAAPDDHIFRVFGCFAYINAALRDATFADKSHRGYFVGLKWPLLDRYLVFVSSLDKVLEIGHVIFVEVKQLQRKDDEIFTVNNKRKTVRDFESLTNMVYEDTKKNIYMPPHESQFSAKSSCHGIQRPSDRRA